MCRPFVGMLSTDETDKPVWAMALGQPLKTLILDW